MKNTTRLAAIRAWRAADQHTGIGKGDGILYTYEHVEERDITEPRANVYRVETYIPFVMPTPLHRNVHFVPADRLDAFFDGWGEHGEIVIDIRPLTWEQAADELRDFRERASRKASPRI